LSEEFLEQGRKLNNELNHPGRGNVFFKKAASLAVFDPGFSRGSLGKCRGRDLGSPRGTMGSRRILPPLSEDFQGRRKIGTYQEEQRRSIGYEIANRSVTCGRSPG